MAFDQSTRNRLNRFVADSRGVLAKEFTRQLQAIYGMNPATGEVADINSLAGLTPHQQETAQLLRDTFEHYLAANDHSTGKIKEKENRLAALDRIVREQAFTVLNRLAALRMSEARGFLTESLANGYDSKGFQLFHRIAGTSLGETGEAYTHYLFSIFDEFTLDLSVLFDRFAAQGRLFPSTPVLLELLALINNDEVAPLWSEDETIGWIYQYFNSQEERKKMRDASQAPRNSRELAVRNQFFTPRYVVEFLTDNTLGRIWYEMTKGQTRLASECEYLVKRPNEIFLNQGEQAPEQVQTEGLSQEELLKQTVYIEHRSLKDPRDIKMLDPACGSMHFGLYCFDLFERIYDEAWDIEAAQGENLFARENNQASLIQSYHDKAEFLTHVPRLIIEHNIHGVDIDPRAAQVAGMSLWQRAHNSWQQAGIKPQHRPQITKSNIVCAEPMPGEKELLQEFASQLKPTVLGQLVEVIFEKMQLAGEAGTLLKIEKEIEDAIAGAKSIWQQQNQALSQFPDLAKVAKRQNEGKGEVDFDVSDIDDEGFWQQAEQKIHDALAQYASSTSSDMTEQKRLFASDAAKGFAFIDLCKKRFDVVLMNPPFGSPTKSVNNYIKGNYSDYGHDIINNFIERAENMSHEKRFCGVILSRTLILNERISSFRQDYLLGKNSLSYILDLGNEVLDAAVDTAALIIKDKSQLDETICGDILRVDKNEKEFAVKQFSNLAYDRTYFVKSSDFERIPMGVLCYWIKPWLLEQFTKPKLEPNVGVIKKGLITGDDERFARNVWETKDAATWSPLFKGGGFSTFYAPLDMRINWENEGQELKAFAIGKYGSISRTLKNTAFIGKKSLGWGIKNSIGFGVRLIESENVVYNDNGPAFFPEKDIFKTEEKYRWIALFNSSLFKILLRVFQVGERGRYQWLSAHVKMLPEPLIDIGNLDEHGKLITDGFKYLYSLHDESENFNLESFLNLINQLEYGGKLTSVKEVGALISNIEIHYERLDREVLLVYGIDINSFYDFTSDFLDDREKPQNNFIRLSEGFSKSYKDRIISVLLGIVFGRWSANEKQCDFICSKDIAEKINELNLTASTRSKVEDFFYNVVSKTYMEKVNGFFDAHLKLYSANKRTAPIYLPLQSKHQKFTIWVLYHNLSNSLIWNVINDYIEPKLDALEKDILSLKDNNVRSLEEEKKIDNCLELVGELEDFRVNLTHISKFWKPNLDDGVQITSAPLWKLFQHNTWQKKLKQTWDKLQDGEYDWAHLAFSTWPERVLKKCHADRSLAIAHDVENDLWHEVEVIKKNKKEPVWEWQPKPISDAELNAYIKEKITTDERLKLYRSNIASNLNGGKL